MLFNTVILATLAAVVFGQTTTSTAPTSSSTCAAQNILDACLSTEQAGVNNCSGNDWDCLCTAWGNVLTCYNNCPGDSAVYGAQQSKTQYCNAASAYGTKTASATSLVAAATSTSSTSLTTTASGTASGASASATHNAASSLQVGSGIIAVAVAGFGLLA